LWGLGKDKNKRFSYSNVSLAGDALSESAKRLLNGSLALKSYVPALSDKEVARICTPPEKKEPEEGKKVGEQKKPGQPLDRRR